MFKFRRLLCVVLVCALVGVAYGAATKIKSFTTYNEPDGADAMAIMNIADGQAAIIQVMVNGFSPNTTYFVFFYDCLGSEQDSGGFFTTDDHGNSTWHINYGGAFPALNLRLYACPGSACEIRAQGVCP
ncbi:MAG: hypothetical protein AAB363_04280 [Planctomycetota bacterium]